MLVGITIFSIERDTVLVWFFSVVPDLFNKVAFFPLEYITCVIYNIIPKFFLRLGGKILISRLKSIRNILSQRFVYFGLIVTLTLIIFYYTKLHNYNRQQNCQQQNNFGYWGLLALCCVCYDRKCIIRYSAQTS